MTDYPYPIIAREGWVHVAASIAAALAVGLLAGFGPKGYELAYHAAIDQLDRQRTE